jgi:hypothetical protein
MFLDELARLICRYGHGTVWGEQAKGLVDAINTEMVMMGREPYEAVEFHEASGSGHPHRFGVWGRIYYQTAPFQGGGVFGCGPRVREIVPGWWTVRYGINEGERWLRGPLPLRFAVTL